MGSCAVHGGGAVAGDAAGEVQGEVAWIQVGYDLSNLSAGIFKYGE